eukprot:scaffold2651_cov118-Isochrysis_galbana.AAC.9
MPATSDSKEVAEPAPAPMTPSGQRTKRVAQGAGLLPGVADSGGGGGGGRSGCASSSNELIA